MSCIRRLLTVQPYNVWFPKRPARYTAGSVVIVHHEPARFYGRHAGKVKKPVNKNSFLMKHMEGVVAKEKSDTPARSSDAVSIGEELTGQRLTSAMINRTLRDFENESHLQELAAENGLGNEKVLQLALMKFHQDCLKTVLSVELYVIISDILNRKDHVISIFPYFLEHARNLFPFIESMEDMKKISDLTQPALWYPEARKIKRKIIMHVGPTNSGKTYHALKSLMASESGVYCGPLRLLAMEIHKKCNDAGTPCDLITGELRRYAIDPETPAGHVSCTVEMTNVSKPCDVAVIDEIQMIGDVQRGFAWTRALLGIPAKELHLCGEPSAIELVRDLMAATGDTVEVKTYKRLTSLRFLSSPLKSLTNVQPGDCIVCFSRENIFRISRDLEDRGHTVAVIYGGLPPGTKLVQADRFNDPNDPCNVLVATDAIGMGLNLSIRRVIFHSLQKMTMSDKGAMAIQKISTSLALQISGRAGRFRSQYEKGEVTTFNQADIKELRSIITKPISLIPKAGLNPTLDQLELFAYHLPNASIVNLIDMFVEICMMDSSSYFMCSLDSIKELAAKIEHIDLSLKAKYSLCCAPVNVSSAFVCTMFIKFARRLSQGSPLTFTWLCTHLRIPFKQPQNVEDLLYLEAVSDIVDLYLWLHQKFKSMFLFPDLVLELQTDVEQAIQGGLLTIRNLSVKTSEKLPQMEIGRRGTETLPRRINLKRGSIDMERIIKKSESIDMENVITNIMKPTSPTAASSKVENVLTSKAMEDDPLEDWVIDGSLPGAADAEKPADTGAVELSSTKDHGLTDTALVLSDTTTVKKVPSSVDEAVKGKELNQMEKLDLEWKRLTDPGATSVSAGDGGGSSKVVEEVMSVEELASEEVDSNVSASPAESTDPKDVTVTAIISSLSATSFVNDFTKRNRRKRAKSCANELHFAALADALITPPIKLDPNACINDFDTTTCEQTDVFSNENVTSTSHSGGSPDNIAEISKPTAGSSSQPASKMSMQLSSMFQTDEPEPSTEDIEPTTTEQKPPSKVADTLIEEGVLTKERLAALHAEWAAEIGSDTDGTDTESIQE